MTGSSSAKRFCRLIRRIGTHSGKFHCDEVLAVCLLRLLPECVDAELVRSRDDEVLATCDIVVDVGGVYEPDNYRYDHHQRSFSETMCSLSGGKKPWNTRLSSAGLVYFHHGRQVLEQMVGGTSEDRESIYDQLYATLIEEVDAVDNGIQQYSCEELARYQITSTLSQRVGRLNPRWNEADQDTDARFEKALSLVSAEFRGRVQELHETWLPARTVLQLALSSRRAAVHPSGRLLVLPGGGVPWKEHLFQLEQLADGDDQLVQFVLFEDRSSGHWRVQAVPPSADSFLMRTPLKRDWQGLRDEQLRTVSGVADAVFVHANGFIGGAESRDSAVKMALTTLKDAGKL